ncbi:MAG: thioredoxin domain-containing protein [Acidimicrobiia bacterium]|nr:MAG: thioredoxin domain-containing protein [Acidimicrobiia bacterium]
MSSRNRLADATSPYLLQHATNPVHWYEWGPEAFDAARRRDVPILLSVGYASCHWCHVMAHESFEDPATAELMNRLFVNVKVDREERPDVDRIYMDAVQASTGRGGWPMTVFLTPGGEPFHAGTYFPKNDRPGIPSFTRVLIAVRDAWDDRRGEVLSHADRLTETIRAELPAGDPISTGTLRAAYGALASNFDRVQGGFGGAPKFPQAPTLEFLLRIHKEEWAPEAATILDTTLSGIDRGGIHDHVGGGFARYSVDATWSVPHFEKMLYDNALLTRLFARWHQVTGETRHAFVALETAAYMLESLRLPGGAFATGEDADSDGEEGTFYVFTEGEVLGAAGEHGVPVCRHLGVTARGNFEGRNVLRVAEPIQVTADATGIEVTELEAAVRATLRNLALVRAGRSRPAIDDKAIAAWNGLAIRALAEASVALGAPHLLQGGIDAARFVLAEMRAGSGRLHRTWRQGRFGPPGFCDDYAAMALACFAIYQATGDEAWFSEAAQLSTEMVDLFHDPGRGFFATGHDAEALVARPHNRFDNPTPSDNSLAAEALLHMAAFTGEGKWHDLVTEVLAAGEAMASSHPSGVGHLLAVAWTSLAPPLEVAIVGPEIEPLLAVVDETYRPEVFLARGGVDSVVPLLQSRPPVDGRATAYVCRGFSCDAPVTEPGALRSSLSANNTPTTPV